MGTVPKRITIPATIEDAVTALNGLGALLTAKHWEKASIVYAFTKEGRPGPRSGENSSDLRLSISDFARLGISGLTTRDTVRYYRDNWQAAILEGEVGVPLPGDKVTLPDMDWPAQEQNTGSRVSANPVKAVEQVIEKHGKDVLTKAAEQSKVVANATADAVEAEPVRREVTRRAAVRASAYDKSTKEARQSLEAVAARAKAGYDEVDTGTTDEAAQAVERITRHVHEQELLWAMRGGAHSADLVGKLSELSSAVDDWRKRITGTGSVEITENDRVWAEELGIDLGV